MYLCPCWKREVKAEVGQRPVFRTELHFPFFRLTALWVVMNFVM
jgi:hypothetical protein